MLSRPSGRGVPPHPGWTGTITRPGSCASNPAKLSTDCGPAPPCNTRKARPEPYSVTVTGTAPIPSTGTVTTVVLGIVNHSLVRANYHEGAYESGSHNAS